MSDLFESYYNDGLKRLYENFACVRRLSKQRKLREYMQECETTTHRSRRDEVTGPFSSFSTGNVIRYSKYLS